MVRPLHLDEAQRALHVKASAQSGDNPENSEKSELALEFSRLLEQVQGPVAAAHDEVMALGLALAQAIPTVHQSRIEVQQAEAVSCGNREDVGQDGDSPELQADTVDRPTVNQESQRVNTSVERAQEVEVKDVSDQAARTEEAAEKETGGTSDFSEEDVAMALDILSLDKEKETEGVEISVIHDESKDVDLVVGSGINTLLRHSEGQSSEEAAEEEQTFLSSADVLASDVDMQEVKQGSRGAEKTASESVTEVSESISTQQENVSPLQQRERLVEARTRSVRSDVTLDVKERVRTAGVAKAAQTVKSTLYTDAPEQGSHTLQSPLVTKDRAVQITLLRQAFEGLKLQKQDGLEQKSRTSMPQVTTALGAASEVRASKHQLSTKGMRHLDRATTQRMLERVESTLKEAARSRDGKTISLRLDPAQLGRVQVDVSLREGALHARITPENRQVLASLREHAHELQGALRKLGLNVDTVTVSVTSETGQDLSEFGQELNNGKSYQHERNNMPDNGGQVPENRIGSELAERSTVGSPQQDAGVEDHWVA